MDESSVEARARLVAPVLLLDRAEPFRPFMVAIRTVSRRSTADCLEFSVCWDADIGHVREVEHVWVITNEQDEIVQVSASGHGIERVIPSSWRGRPRLAAEPGKHAMYGAGEEPALPRDVIEWMCGPAAGSQGFFPWGDHSSFTSPADVDRQAMRRLREFSFRPTWNRDLEVDLLDVPWILHSDLDAVLRDHGHQWVASVSTDPLGWAAGSWNGAEELVLVRDCQWDGVKWTGDGIPLDSVLARARTERRRLLLDLRRSRPNGIAQLWAVAWSHYCTSMVIVVATDQIVDEASRQGFTTARWVEPATRPRSGGWVAAADPHTVARWSPHALTVGPGPADVSCAFD